MPMKHAIWQVGAQPAPLAVTQLESEDELERMILEAPKLLSSEWMPIGHQVTTDHGGRIDLLAIAPDASLVVVELKRDRTPWTVVAQALDYASWVKGLTAERIARIYERYKDGQSLDADFRSRFGYDLDAESLNSSHQIIVVAAELDDSTERIVQYLNERDIAINVLFFQVFEHAGERLLSRAWLIDPTETQENAAITNPRGGQKEPWNGEFYVSYGPIDASSWKDARQYGFISAGGGPWYTTTLQLLESGSRIWVKIPKVGYVGVGRVAGEVASAEDFKVSVDGKERPVLEVIENADRFITASQDPERAHMFVAVDWLDSVAEEDAVAEVGLFGNQNTVCRPMTPKWRHTVERLKTKFGAWNS